jgi:tetratricopeptide (TPR) repeat protein
MDEATFRRRLAAWQARHELRSGTATAMENLDPPAGRDGALARSRDAREARIGAVVAALDAERVDTPLGTVVRIERPARPLPLDRSLLARLPGFPDPAAPLVCLDTETTGLATAAGTLVFLVGLGWWDGSRFRQVGLLLPDEADEPALLDLVGRHVPAGARLVTYNGRAFDWPLLVARFRLRRCRPPEPTGHLDLLPIARRWFRHRLPDARLRSVERHVLGVERIDDIEGWEIPASYRRFLDTGRTGELPRIVDHNERDVWSLARLLVLLAERYADPDRLEGRDPVPASDLAALARAFRRAGRLADALACLDAAARLVEARRPPATGGSVPAPGRRSVREADGAVVPEAQIAAERARVLARLGEPDAAIAAWLLAARGGGIAAARAWIEIAKLHEWRRRDLGAALGAVGEAWRIVERARLLGRPAADLEADLAGRTRRLRRRLARLRRASPAGGNAPIDLGSRGDRSLGPTETTLACRHRASPAADNPHLTATVA